MKSAGNRVKILSQLMRAISSLLLAGLLSISTANAHSTDNNRSYAGGLAISLVKGYVPAMLIPHKINNSYRWSVSKKISLFYARKFNAATVKVPSIGFVLQQGLEKRIHIDYTISTTGNSIFAGTYIRF